LITVATKTGSSRIYWVAVDGDQEWIRSGSDQPDADRFGLNTDVVDNLDTLFEERRSSGAARASEQDAVAVGVGRGVGTAEVGDHALAKVDPHLYEDLVRVLANEGLVSRSSGAGGIDGTSLNWPQQGSRPRSDREQFAKRRMQALHEFFTKAANATAPRDPSTR
jgi:hypothetical protein